VILPPGTERYVDDTKKWKAKVTKVYTGKFVQVTDLKGDIEVFPVGSGRCRDDLEVGTTGTIFYFPKDSGKRPRFEPDTRVHRIRNRENQK
jgi:hypothetical protein